MRRIFILGNGPSLLTQANLLTTLGADTFCCNRFTHWGYPLKPTYYACSANAVLKGVEPEDPPYTKRRFIVSRRLDELQEWTTWTAVYKKEWHDLLMPGHMSAYPLVRAGATMPGIMVQLAAWMGYDEMYLLGVEQRGKGHVFDPTGTKEMSYFIPDEEVLFNNWRSIKDAYEDRGIRIRDCTPSGRLNDILAYVPLEEVIGARVA